MLPVILSTKLFLPPKRAGWVVRPRLLEKLNEGLRLGCKLALVSAPAGFGKTTLVTDWLDSLQASSLPPRITWLSLDGGDNDLAVFLCYLVAALQKLEPGLGEATQLSLENILTTPIETLLLPLVNDLARLADPMILVLDDYHVIQKPAIHEALAFMIERLPLKMQVVITTRQDPLLPLARWRARRQLVDIRLKDLRFTAEEAAEFLNTSMGLGLQVEDVQVLEKRTEGWIAGLQLAGISILQSEQEGEFVSFSELVHSFAGNDRFIMDYLIDEVLDRQPENVQRFLLYTSVLERFNDSLCREMLKDQPGSESAGTVIDYLDRANLFLIPLDNRREWYRYHHLFAELLQYRLKAMQGKAILAELKRRASLWFDENGFYEEAIAYAQAAGDWRLSSHLILKYSTHFMQRSEVVTLLRWLSGLPDEVIRNDASLSKIYGYVLTVTGKLTQGEFYFQLAQAGFQNAPEQLGSTLAFMSYNVCFQGDFYKEIDMARRALSLLPLENYWMRGIAAVSLGIGLCHTGDITGSEEAMREAYAAGLHASIVRVCVHSLGYLGRMSILHLDFAQAESYFRQAIQFQMDERLFSGCDMSLFDLALLKYLQNDFEQVFPLIEKGLEANLRSGSIEMRAYGFRLAARYYQLTGQPDLAQEFLLKALHLAADNNLSPLTLSLNAAFQVEMSLTDGNLREAERAAPQIGHPTGLYSFNFYPELAAVLLHIVQGRKVEAQKLLQPAILLAMQPGWEFPRLQVRILQALCETDPAKARDLLYEALQLAEPVGVVRVFIDCGEPMRLLLRDLRPLMKSSESAFTDRLLSLMQEQSPGVFDPQSGKMNQGLVEPLSDRELEVLRLLADGLSNAEIAQRLYLSPNTLKAHTQNIYSKMDVHSRVQVVNKARELGILSS